MIIILLMKMFQKLNIHEVSFCNLSCSQMMLMFVRINSLLILPQEELFFIL